MNETRIWYRWRRFQQSTAEIARRMNLPEHEVARVVAQGLDAVYCNVPMPWRRMDGTVEVRATPWLIGDCLNAGEAAFGESYAQALPDDRLAVKTLANYKWVASRVESSRRREGLAFGHHAEVAALEPQEQDRWLDRAGAESLSRSALRAALRGLDAPSDDGAAADGQPEQPQAEVLPPKARPTVEVHDADEDQLESLKRAWNRAGLGAREQFLAWKDDNERPVFDAGSRDMPPMPKFLRRGVRA